MSAGHKKFSDLGAEVMSGWTDEDRRVYEAAKEAFTKQSETDAL